MGEVKLFRLANLTGGINSVAEVDQLQTFDFNGQGVACEATDIENFMPIYRGGQYKTFGYSLYQNLGTHPITGLYKYIKADGTTFFMAGYNGDVYYIDGTNKTSICITVTTGASLDMVTAMNKLVICDGTLAPKYWNGTIGCITTIQNGAPVGAVRSGYAQNRLWMFGGTSNPSLLYYSAPGDLTSGYNGENIYTFSSVTGDVRTSQWTLTGVNDTNTKQQGSTGLLYFCVTTTGALNIYKDSAGACLTATASAPASLPGTATITQSNSSGISGTCYVTSGTAETNVANQYLTYTTVYGTGGFVNCDTNDGFAITDMLPSFMPSTTNAIVFVGKENKTGIVTGDGSSGSPYTYSTINYDFGVPGMHQIIQEGQRVTYLTPQGVASFDMGAGPYSIYFTQAKLTYQYLSEKVRDKLNTLSLVNLDKAVAWHDWLNTRFSYAVTESGQSHNNVIWHFDYRLNCWYKTRPAHHILCAYVDSISGILYTGDENGNVWKWGYYNRSSGGVSVASFGGSDNNAYFMTPYLDFGDPNTKKQIKLMRFLIRSQGAYSLTVQCNFDYGLYSSSTPYVLPLVNTSYKWDGGTWNNDGSYQWGSTPLQEVRIEPTAPIGEFRSVQFNFTIGGANPLEIFDIEFETEFLDERDA